MRKASSIFIAVIILVCVLGMNAKQEQLPGKKETLEQMTKLAKEFALVAPGGDSVFAVNQSAYGLFTKDFFREGTFPEGAEKKFKKAKIRDVVGPFVVDNKVEIYKVLERRELPDSCQVRIIWVEHKGAPGSSAAAKRTKPQSLVRADSIRNIVVSGQKKMEDIVLTCTDDPGSLSNNGNYGWMYARCGIVSEILYVGFTEPVGKTVIIDSAFGYYVVQVLAQSKTRHPYTIVSDIVRQFSPEQE